MSTLFILAHPNPEKSRFNKSWAQAAEELDYPVHILREHVNEEGHFNIRREQSLLSSYQGIVISFPIQWYAPNWLLQKWLADVLTADFAYGQAHELLDKDITCLISTGVDEESYSHKGALGITIPELTSCIRLTAGFCGMKYHHPYIFYGAGKAGNDKVEQSTKTAMMHLREFSAMQKMNNFKKEHAHS